MATKSTKKEPSKAAKATSKKTAQKPEAKAESKRAKGRFVGWQVSPYTQSAFGATTKGGSYNTESIILASTGSVQKTQPRYYLLDATDAPIGRLATTIATILMGKNRSTFTRGAGSGDAVIVVNAAKAFFTSNKADKKIYYWHTQYMGGLKSETAGQLLKRKPEKAIWLAVQGMLPKNKLSRYQLTLLKIYEGAEHPHKAQKPIAVKVTGQALKKIAVA